MRKLEVNQIENVFGGNDISDTVAGACAGLGLAAALKLVVLSTPAAIGVGAVCAVNSGGRYFGFW